MKCCFFLGLKTHRTWKQTPFLANSSQESVLHRSVGRCELLLGCFSLLHCSTSCHVRSARISWSNGHHQGPFWHLRKKAKQDSWWKICSPRMSKDYSPREDPHLDYGSTGTSMTWLEMVPVDPVACCRPIARAHR